MSSIGPTYRRAVADVVSVLFTADRRVFLEQDDDSIRLALEWERDEVLLERTAQEALAVAETEEDEQLARQLLAVARQAQVRRVLYR